VTGLPQATVAPGPVRDATPARPRVPAQRTTWWRRLLRDRVLLLAAIPGMGLLLLFQYVPLLGNIIAFKDYEPFIGIVHSPWIGLANFYVVSNGDPAFLNALGNTLIITLLQVLIVFPVPIGLAMLLDSLVSERIKRIVQSVLYLPHFLSWIIVIAIFQQMLGDAGLINNFLRGHGLHTISIISNPDLFKLLVTSQVLWKDAGWATILFIAALSRIDPTLYEAAAIDGAGRWRQRWHVSLPGLRSVIVLLLILRLGQSLTFGFEQIIPQQQAVGVGASEVLDTYVFNNGIVNGDWGIAAAVGLVKGVVGMLIVFGANKVAHLFGEQGIYQ
jgi:putative aldouronate transport system permease protein